MSFCSTTTQICFSVGKKKANINAIIYLHNITDNRVQTRPDLSVTTLKNMCKSVVSDNVRSILVTTMWTGQEEPSHDEKEIRLRESWTKSMPGMKMVRYDKSITFAWNIVKYALGQPGVELAMDDRGPAMDDREPAMDDREPAMDNRELSWSIFCLFQRANHYPTADPRTLIKNFCEKKFYQSPDYRTEKAGPQHSPTYSTTVYSECKIRTCPQYAKPYHLKSQRHCIWHRFWFQRRHCSTKCSYCCHRRAKTPGIPTLILRG